MMRKAFTLAEILLTLVIVGIVAALTIPALIANVQQNQYKAAWKQTFSIINQGYTRFSADKGISTIKNYYSNPTYPQLHTDIKNELAPYFNVKKSCNSGQILNNCWHDTNKSYFLNNDPVSDNGVMAGFILNNGMLVKVGWSGDNVTCVSGLESLTECLNFVVDVNGFTPPNTVGKDIFFLFVNDRNQILPTGTVGHPSFSCDSINWGHSCSAKYLKE